jgi:tetratricopeptide (TPR) repeat protein
VPEDLVGPSRLLRGRLLLMLKRPAEARRTLESIKSPAPPAVVTQAQHLLARSYQDEESWAEAAKVWRELADRPESAPHHSRVLTQLGICYRRLNQPDKAAAAWEQVLALGSTDDEAVASLGLGEQRLTADPTHALEHFERALHNVNSPSDWKNALIELPRAQERFEAACQALRDAHQYEAAIQLATLYERLAPPGKGQFLGAQAAEDWAKAGGNREEPAVREHYLKAAAKFEASALPACPPTQRADRLWRGMKCALAAYRPGPDAVTAARLLRELDQTGGAEAQVCEGWYLLAEAQRAAKEDQATLQSLEECVRHQGKFAYRARYGIARDKILHGDIDGAQTDLLTNLQLLPMDMDREAHENTIFELASLLYHRREYRQAASRFEDALELYPNSPRALDGRFLLAESYRHLAEQAAENVRDIERLKMVNSNGEEFYRKQYSQYLTDAAIHYNELSDLLSKTLDRRKLTPEEEMLLRSSMFSAANCRVQQGGADIALPLYSSLAELYHDRVDRLHALAGKRQCYFLLAAREPDATKRADLEKNARDVLALIREALDPSTGLQDDAFDKKVSRWSRQQWSDWVKKEEQNDSKKTLNVRTLPGFSTTLPGPAH